MFYYASKFLSLRLYRSRNFEIGSCPQHDFYFDSVSASMDCFDCFNFKVILKGKHSFLLKGTLMQI